MSNSKNFKNKSREFLKYVTDNVENGLNINTVQKYLDKKVDLEIQNEFGHTVLMCVARYSNKEVNFNIVKLLIKYGANVNSINKKYGGTILTHTALFISISAKIETIQLLLKHKANVNLKARNDQTTLIFASFGLVIGNFPAIEIIKLLLKYGANTNLQDKNGYTALITILHFALDDDLRKLEAIKLLLEYKTNKTNTEIKNNEGKRAIDYAVEKINNNKLNMEIVKLLMDYGSIPKEPHNIILNYNNPNLEDFIYFRNYIFSQIVVNSEYYFDVMNKLNVHCRDINNLQLLIFRKKMNYIFDKKTTKKVSKYLDLIQNLTKFNKDIVNIIGEYIGFIF